eukprot:g13054.t1
MKEVLFHTFHADMFTTYAESLLDLTDTGFLSSFYERAQSQLRRGAEVDAESAPVAAADAVDGRAPSGCGPEGEERLTWLQRLDLSTTLRVLLEAEQSLATAWHSWAFHLLVRLFSKERTDGRAGAVLEEDEHVEALRQWAYRRDMLQERIAEISPDSPEPSAKKTPRDYFDDSIGFSVDVELRQRLLQITEKLIDVWSRGYMLADAVRKTLLPPQHRGIEIMTVANLLTTQFGLGRFQADGAFQALVEIRSHLAMQVANAKHHGKEVREARSGGGGGVAAPPEKASSAPADATFLDLLRSTVDTFAAQSAENGHEAKWRVVDNHYWLLHMLPRLAISTSRTGVFSCVASDKKTVDEEVTGRGREVAQPAESANSTSAAETPHDEQAVDIDALAREFEDMVDLGQREQPSAGRMKGAAAKPVQKAGAGPETLVLQPWFFSPPLVSDDAVAIGHFPRSESFLSSLGPSASERASACTNTNTALVSEILGFPPEIHVLDVVPELLGRFQRAARWLLSSTGTSEEVFEEVQQQQQLLYGVRVANFERGLELLLKLQVLSRYAQQLRREEKIPHALYREVDEFAITQTSVTGEKAAFESSARPLVDLLQSTSLLTKLVGMLWKLFRELARDVVEIVFSSQQQQSSSGAAPGGPDQLESSTWFRALSSAATTRAAGSGKTVFADAPLGSGSGGSTALVEVVASLLQGEPTRTASGARVLRSKLEALFEEPERRQFLADEFNPWFDAAAAAEYENVDHASPEKHAAATRFFAGEGDEELLLRAATQDDAPLQHHANDVSERCAEYFRRIFLHCNEGLAEQDLGAMTAEDAATAEAPRPSTQHQLQSETYWSGKPADDLFSSAGGLARKRSNHWMDACFDGEHHFYAGDQHDAQGRPVAHSHSDSVRPLNGFHYSDLFPQLGVFSQAKLDVKRQVEQELLAAVFPADEFSATEVAAVATRLEFVARKPADWQLFAHVFGSNAEHHAEEEDDNPGFYFSLQTGDGNLLQDRAALYFLQEGPEHFRRPLCLPIRQLEALVGRLPPLVFDAFRFLALVLKRTRLLHSDETSSRPLSIAMQAVPPEQSLRSVRELDVVGAEEVVALWCLQLCTTTPANRQGSRESGPPTDVSDLARSPGATGSHWNLGALRQKTLGGLLQQCLRNLDWYLTVVEQFPVAYRLLTVGRSVGTVDHRAAAPANVPGRARSASTSMPIAPDHPLHSGFAVHEEVGRGCGGDAMQPAQTQVEPRGPLPAPTKMSYADVIRRRGNSAPVGGEAGSSWPSAGGQRSNFFRTRVGEDRGTGAGGGALLPPTVPDGEAADLVPVEFFFVPVQAEEPRASFFSREWGWQVHTGRNGAQVLRNLPLTQAALEHRPEDVTVLFREQEWIPDI